MYYTQALAHIQKIIEENDAKILLQKIVDFLHTSFAHYNWVGIYLIHENMLLLKAWQGKKATEHTKIPLGVGICGSAAQTGKTEIIDNVKDDQRYLACFASTRSELVVPIQKNRRIIGEIDIDSDTPAAFTKNDAQFVEKIADMLSQHIA